MLKKILFPFALCLACILSFMAIACNDAYADTINSQRYFTVSKISNKITRISGAADELMYLIEGENKAVLIDTGVGIGDLKSVVDGLTNKKITVLLTHGHLDHAMGAAQFDDVYMSTEDKEVYKAHSNDSFRKSSITEDCGLKINEDFREAKDLSLIKPLNDGDIFDLGGITLQSFKVPGHTPGSMAILDKEDRILFLGDACNTFTFLYDEFTTSVEEYKTSLKTLTEKTKGLYDTAYISHGSGNIDKNIIGNVLDVCDEILNGTDFHKEIKAMGKHPAFLAKKTVSDKDLTRIDGLEGNIVYTKIKK